MITPAMARGVLDEYKSLLEGTPNEVWNVQIGTDKWTLGEITGHLVDSAVNNHQRFVRLRFGNLESFPGYEAEPWVEAQQYASFDKKTLINLWQCMNELLLRIAFMSPKGALEHCWKTEKGDQTLSFLITDYYEHMKIHIEHYRARLTEICKAKQQKDPA